MEENTLTNTNFMPKAKELRMAARAALKGHWTNAVLCALVYTIVTGVCSAIPYVNYFAILLITMPLSYGVVLAFLRHMRGEDDSDLVTRPFDAFKNYGRYLGTSFLAGLFTALWTILFIIPGIVMGLAYAMTPYIMHDNPELGAMDCIRRSKQMMKGYKWKLFCLRLSFIGWLLLGCITFGIGLLWVMPYMECAEAKFYEELKARQA